MSRGCAKSSKDEIFNFQKKPFLKETYYTLEIFQVCNRCICIYSSIVFFFTNINPYCYNYKYIYVTLFKKFFIQYNNDDHDEYIWMTMINNDDHRMK